MLRFLTGAAGCGRRGSLGRSFRSCWTSLMRSCWLLDGFVESGTGKKCFFAWRMGKNDGR